MTYEKFIEKNIGKKIDYDGVYGVQCVDLINQYMFDILELKINYFPRYAKNFWLDRNKNSFLIKNFTFLTPTAKLQKGDIGVRVSGTAGHVFIIDHQNGNKLYIYDQNATGKGDAMTARIITCNSNNITGVLRPKNQKNLIKGVTKIKLKESPCTFFQTNAYLLNDSSVYADNQLTKIVGGVYKNEKVKTLFIGEKNTAIQFGVDSKTYKVGLVPTSLIKKI